MKQERGEGGTVREGEAVRETERGKSERSSDRQAGGSRRQVRRKAGGDRRQVERKADSDGEAGRKMEAGQGS